MFLGTFWPPAKVVGKDESNSKEKEPDKAN